MKNENTKYLLLCANNVYTDIGCTICPSLKDAQEKMQDECDAMMEDFPENFSFDSSDSGASLHNESSNDLYYWSIMPLAEAVTPDPYVSRIQKLHQGTPSGVIHDADTILADIMEKASEEFCAEAFQDAGKEILALYQASTDRDSLKYLFSLLTGKGFDEYLKLCEDNITRKELSLSSLVGEGERIAEYAITGSYCTYHCIVPEGDTSHMDISACLEDTLHRILDAGTPEDVQAIMGARVPDENERDDLEEFGEYTDIDLGYVLPGLILSFI